MTFAAATRPDPRFLAWMDSYANAVELLQGITGLGALRLGGAPPPPASGDPHAEAHANALLCGRLSPVDAALWRATARLMRPSRLWPGVEYLIQRSGPVKVVERGDVKQSLCVVVAQGEPESDRIMTILDLIESDERRLWEMAVATPGPRDGERWPGLIVPAPPDGMIQVGAHPVVRLSAAVGIGAGLGLCFFLWALWS